MKEETKEENREMDLTKKSKSCFLIKFKKIDKPRANLSIKRRKEKYARQDMRKRTQPLKQIDFFKSLEMIL